MSRTLWHTHSIDHSSTRTWHKHCKCPCAWNFLSCLTFCWSASSFNKQVYSVKEYLTRTQTDAHVVTVCLWTGYVKNVAVTRTQQNLPPFNKTATSLAKTQLLILGSPGKALNFFFLFWISHCQLRCELWRPEFGSLYSAMSVGADQSADQRRNPQL